MAAAWCQLAIVAALCLTGAQARPNPVQIQLDMLEVRTARARRRLGSCRAAPEHRLSILQRGTACYLVRLGPYGEG